MQRPALTLTMISIFSMSWSSSSFAHVKWFSSFDIGAPPTDIEVAFNSDFLALFALSVALLIMGALIAGTPVGRVLISGINRLSWPLEANSDLLIRAACGFFFVSLWNIGGIILTPELKTSEQWISWFQLALAATLLWRQALPLTAGGMVLLYAIGVYNYGLFHLLDYPVFIGLAAYFTLTGLETKLFKCRPLDVLRTMAAITLMWASVEKWAYPQWSHPLIAASPGMTLGFSPEVFMRAAGVIEFALSFALLLGPLVRRVSATILFALFVSAIGPFGKIDAVGHAPIIAAVVAIMFDTNPGGAMLDIELKSFWSAAGGSAALTAAYSALLITFVSGYYLIHAEVYGPMPVALCECPSHQPDRTSFMSPAPPQPLSRSGPICQVLLASTDWLSSLASPGRPSAAENGSRSQSKAGARKTCVVDMAGSTNALPLK